MINHLQMLGIWLVAFTLDSILSDAQLNLHVVLTQPQEANDHCENAIELPTPHPLCYKR
jgi:hypothetical protein